MSGRLLCKIKEANDETVDYTVPSNKLAVLSGILQAQKQEIGKCALLAKNTDIDSIFLYDENKVSGQLAMLNVDPKEDKIVVFSNGLIWSRYLVSLDNGATWVAPRDEGGEWVLGLDTNAGANFRYYLFEFNGVETLYYIADSSDSALTRDDGWTHPGLAALFDAVEYGDVGIAVCGTQTYFTLRAGSFSKAYYTASFGSTTGGSLTEIVESYPEYNIAYPQAFYIGQSGGSSTSNWRKIYCKSLDFETNAGIEVTYAGNYSTAISGVAISCAVNACFLSPVGEDYLIRIESSGTVGQVTSVLCYTQPNNGAIYFTSEDSISLETDERIGVAYVDGSDIKVASSTSTYTISDLTSGTWDDGVASVCSDVETDIVDLSSQAASFSGQAYLRALTRTKTWFTGETTAEDIYESDTGDQYLQTSISQLDNCQTLYALAVRPSDPYESPTEFTGIMLSEEDQLICYSNINTLLTVMGVEQ
jgi:hypothetical protein